MKGSGRGLIIRYYRIICLEGLKEITKQSGYRVPGVTFEPGASQIQSRSVGRPCLQISALRQAVSTWILRGFPDNKHLRTGHGCFVLHQHNTGRHMSHALVTMKTQQRAPAVTRRCYEKDVYQISLLNFCTQYFLLP